MTNIQLRSKNTSLIRSPFLTHPTSLDGSKTFINASRSSATVSHFLLDRVSTPPAAARARSSPLNISDRALRSHSTPCETAPTRSSSNLAANATSYRPTACNTPQPQNSTHPTTLNHVTNIQLSSYPISATPDLRWGCQDFQQSSAQLSNREPLLVRSTANIPSTCHFAKLQCGNFFQSPLEPFTAPGHTTATQLLQPNFHGIGRPGRLLHSHGQSLQQMKQ